MNTHIRFHSSLILKKAVVLSICLIVSLSGYAFDFLAGGLKYSTNNDGTSVSVIRQDTSIEKAAIPDKVKYNIKDERTKYLESITLPKSIQKIGYSAFWDCGDLRSITVLNETPPIMIADGFQGVSKDSCIVYVPKGSEAAYKKADFWKEFRRILNVNFKNQEDE